MAAAETSLNIIDVELTNIIKALRKGKDPKLIENFMDILGINEQFYAITMPDGRRYEKIYEPIHPSSMHQMSHRYKKTTLLMELIIFRNLSMIKRLINGDYKLLINFTVHNRAYPITPLCLACLYYKDEHSGYIIKALIEAGANPNCIPSVMNRKMYRLPLHIMIDKLITAIYIIDRSKAITDEYEDQDIYVEYIHAKFTSCIKMIKYLIDNGADINSINRKNNTILHNLSGDVEASAVESPHDIHLVRSLVSNKYYDFIKYLIKKGADLNMKNDEGKTPLDLVKGQNEKMTVIMEGELNWKRRFNLMGGIMVERMCRRADRLTYMRKHPVSYRWTDKDEGTWKGLTDACEGLITGRQKK